MSKAKAVLGNANASKVVGGLRSSFPVVKHKLAQARGHICSRSEDGYCYTCKRIEHNTHLAIQTQTDVSPGKHCMGGYGIRKYIEAIDSSALELEMVTSLNDIPFYATGHNRVVWTVPVADLLTWDLFIREGQE